MIEYADEFLRLACLTYSEGSPVRRERARALLAEHPEIGSASIHTIAAIGHVAAARSLLATNPELARTPGGPHQWQPLLYLAFSRLDLDGSDYSPIEVAKLLLVNGADPNVGYLWEGLPSPFTALTGAFGEGEDAINQPPHRDSETLARLLLDAGADPNDSQTLYNRQFGRTNAHLELLFAYGLGTGDGGPWHARLGSAHPSPQQLLQDQLLWAAKRDMPERVRLLMKHGVDVDGRGTGHPVFASGSAYAVAVVHGNVEVAQLLADAGATTDGLDDAARLVGAIMRGDQHRAEAMISHHPTMLASVIARHPDLMIRAAENGKHSALPLAARLGWNVNHVQRATALHQAAYLGDLETIQLLLDLGADPTIQDQEFHATPLGWAQHNGQTHVVDSLARFAAPEAG